MCCVVPGSSFKVREQRDEHQAVQLFATSVLAAELHGRVHVVSALRGGEGHRDVGQRAQHLLRRRAHVRRRRRTRGRSVLHALALHQHSVLFALYTSSTLIKLFVFTLC